MTAAGTSLSTGPGVLADLLESNAADRIAVVSVEGDALTYGEIRRRVDRWRDALEARRLPGTARIGLALPSGPDLAVALIAVASHAICAPLRSDRPATQFARDCAELRLDLLLVTEDRVAELSALGLPVACAEPDGISSATRGGGLRRRSAQPDDVALLLRTSGTTGQPKRVPLTHGNLCHSAVSIRRTLQLTNSDRCLDVMPLWHVHGFVAGLLASLAAGASVVCPPSFSPLHFAGWLGHPGATWYTAVPTIHLAVLTAVAGHPPPHRLRFIRSASASLPMRLLTELEDTFGVPVIEAYGMTEASHEVTSNPPPPLPRKRGSVGVSSGASIAVRDPCGNLLRPGEDGEITIRGKGVFAGYEGDLAGSSTFANGWFRTGDRGRMDGDGYLFITGRSKEMINRGGETLAPREIEDVLLDHPDVADVLVFGIAHPTLGEIVGAAVVPRAGATVTAADLRRFAAHRLEAAKVPVRIAVLTAIPRTTTGKPRRAEVARTCEERWESSAALQLTTTVPSTPIERDLTGIWAELLGTGRVDRTGSLCALGVDSLLTTRAANRIEAIFGVRVPSVDLFLADSVAEQAVLIHQLLAESAPDREAR